MGHLDAMRLHRMAIAVVVVSDIRVEEVADALLLLASQRHHDGHVFSKAQPRIRSGYR
jgi:hypothetical protein